jgi:ABC-2 type transport system permease protein
MWGVTKRLGAMPIRKTHLLGGKLLASVSMGMAQYIVLLGLGVALGVGFRSDGWALGLLGLAYVLAISAVALVLAAVSRSPSQASALATAAWLILALLGGGWWPLAYVPRFMQRLGHVSPVAWFLDGLHALVLFQGTWRDVLLPSVVLLLFAGVFLALGVWRMDLQRGERSGGQHSFPWFGRETDLMAS